MKPKPRSSKRKPRSVAQVPEEETVELQPEAAEAVLGEQDEEKILESLILEEEQAALESSCLGLKERFPTGSVLRTWRPSLWSKWSCRLTTTIKKLGRVKAI